MNIGGTMARTAIILVLIMNLAAPLYAAEGPVQVEAYGKAKPEERDTIKELKERALRDALSQASVKAVAAFLKASIPAENSRIADDLGYASVRDDVVSVDIVQEGWDSKERNIYIVSIKALIKPLYPRKTGGLSVKASLVKAELKEGDEVKIAYQANEDANVYIFSVAGSGKVVMLLPNAINQSNLAEAGKSYEFPPEKSPIHITPKASVSNNKQAAGEKIKVIAVRKGIDITPGGLRTGLFESFEAGSGEMISELVQRLNKLDPASWTEQTIVYRITK